MRYRLRASFALAWFALVAFEGAARAQDDVRPVVVEYVAPPPPQCASVEAFQTLVRLEFARRPGPRGRWRFAVLIRDADSEYAGTLTTEDGAITVQASSCDDVTAALAHFIAGAPAEPAALPPLPAEAPPLVLLPPPSAPAPVPAESTSPHETHGADWRLGARFQTWSHGAFQLVGSNAPSYGGMGVVSVELPFGLRKTMFEVALGAMDSSSSAAQLTYYVLDTQTCLVDLELGHTGLSVLGCLRLAGAKFDATGIYGANSGGAFWVGGGGRVRWQSPFMVFVELHLDGVYGTVSSGEDNQPAWADAGVMIGLRL